MSSVEVETPDVLFSTEKRGDVKKELRKLVGGKAIKRASDMDIIEARRAEALDELSENGGNPVEYRDEDGNMASGHVMARRDSGTYTIMPQTAIDRGEFVLMPIKKRPEELKALPRTPHSL